MECVRAGFGNHGDLRAAGGATLSRIVGGAHAELGNGIQRDVEPGFGLLGLLLNAGIVDAVEGVIGVVDGVAVEADVPLRTVARVDGAWRQQHQAGPIAAADWNLFNLLLLDQATDFGRSSSIDGFHSGSHLNGLRCEADLQPRIDCSGLSHGQF